MPPSDYVNTYLNVVCYTDDVTPIKTPIRNYLQSGLGDQSARAEKAYAHLLAALPKLAGTPKGKPLPPVFEVNDETYVRNSIWRVYHGKGSPNEIQDAVYLAGLAGLVNSGNVTAYADHNLGVDCGGFVANYWGMGRPDETTPEPFGYAGFKPRTIWDTYRSLRRKTPAEIQVGDAAIFFSGIKNDDPDIAAKAIAGGGYVPDSGSKAFHIAVVNDVTAATGVEDGALQIAQSSEGKVASTGGNGVDLRPKVSIKFKVSTAHKLVYCPKDANRIYFVGRPNQTPSYAPYDWG